MQELNEQLKIEITDAVSGFVHGWCTVDKALALADIIVTSKPNICVEIGVYSGRSLVPQAMALRFNNVGIVYGIDPWKKENAAEGNCSDADKAWWDSLNLDEIHNYCMAKIWEHELDKWCCVIRSQSHHCHQLFDNVLLHRRDKIIDLLHIDGCHSEQASTRDVDLWLPRVRVGGHILFDDVDWVTTKKAQDMIAEKCSKIGQVGNCAIYRRAK
jgi:hypothetical protein